MTKNVVFRKIYNTILDIFNKNGYNIIVEKYKYVNNVLEHTDTFPSVLIIKLQKGEDVGFIQGSIGTEMDVKIKNKREYRQVINISWVGIKEKYRGKGLSFLLLVFYIMYIYNITKSYEYLTLDNDSDKAGTVDSVYHKIGFIPVSNISEPERQISYNYIYENSDAILENIEKYRNRFNNISKKSHSPIRSTRSKNRNKSRSPVRSTRSKSHSRVKKHSIERSIIKD